MVDLPRNLRDGGRSATPSPARRVGGSTTVWPWTETVAALPPLRRRGASADRPPSGRGRRRWPLCHPFAGAARRRIDHRLAVDGDGGRSATPSPARRVGGSTTVWPWTETVADARPTTVDVGLGVSAPWVGTVRGSAAGRIVAMSVALVSLIDAGSGHVHDCEGSPSFPRRPVYRQTDLVFAGQIDHRHRRGGRGGRRTRAAPSPEQWR